MSINLTLYIHLLLPSKTSSSHAILLLAIKQALDRYRNASYSQTVGNSQDLPGILFHCQYVHDCHQQIRSLANQVPKSSPAFAMNRTTSILDGKGSHL